MVYGVEGNSTFLECVGRSPQAELRWTFQNPEKQHRGGGPTRDSEELVSTFKNQPEVTNFSSTVTCEKRKGF